MPSGYESAIWDSDIAANVVGAYYWDTKTLVLTDGANLNDANEYWTKYKTNDAGDFEYSTGYNLLNYRADEYRISGIFGDEYVLGSFLSRVMPFCFYFLTISKNIGKKIFILAMLLLILVDVLIFFAGERTAFIYLLVGT